jgi:hypothetical protein
MVAVTGAASARPTAERLAFQSHSRVTEPYLSAVGVSLGGWALTRGAVDRPSQQGSPVVGEAAGNPGMMEIE